MERLMERKLAILEAEYNACINAENRAAQQQQQQTSADEAAMHGYGRVGSSGQCRASSRTSGTASSRTTARRRRSSARRGRSFKADMEEERLRHQAEGVESDDGGAAAAAAASARAASEEESKEERRMHAPLTSDKISSIKSVMSGIKLRPPPWAIGMPEEVWMARILERAGFVRRAAAARSGQQQATAGGKQQPQQLLSEEERKKRKEKKKARKAKKAKEAKQQQQADQQAAGQPVGQQAADSDAGADKPTTAAPFAVEDFETSFPALSSPRSTPQPAATNTDSAATQTA